MTGQLSNHLWQSTFFAFVAGLLTVVFRRNRAEVRFWLWFSASVKFLVPFSLQMSLGNYLEWMPAARKVATQFAAPTISIAVEQISRPFSEALPSAAAAHGQVHRVLVGMLCIWLSGFLAITLMRIRHWLRIQAAVRTSTPMDIPSAVEIRCSPGLLEPGVVGLLRPTLLLPEGIVERLTSCQLEAVLAHELCHVRRKDNLFSSLHMIVEGVFWFHPLVWWIGARLVEERERACDEGVLSLGSEPRTYAEAILNVCKLYVESPLACVSGVTGANLKRRIEAIMTNRARLGLNRPKKLLLATAGIAALAGPIAIGIVIGVANAPPVRGQAAAVPVAQTRPAPAVPVDAASPVATAAGGPGTGPVRYEGRRLVAMLVDLDRLTFDEQSRVRQFATDFLHSRIGSTDVVAVLVADEGKIEIVQDFTDDKPVLESAILRAGAGGRHSSVSGAGKPLPSIESAANLLGGIAGKKLLVYFSSGIDRSAMDYQTGLPNAIDVLKRSNVAVYMLDARGMTPAGAAPAAAKFDGEPSVAATLVDTLNRESRNRGEPAATNAIAGLPGRHASIEIDPAGAFQTLSVPVEAAGGRVEIIAEVVRSKTDGAGATVAALRDSVEAPTEYRAKFTLGAGSYDCNLIVKERASGRMYGETIHFEVK